MSYNVFYEGMIHIDRPLDDQTYNIIMGLSKTRRMKWDVEKLKKDGIVKENEDVGMWGEFFFGHKKLGNEISNYVINGNSPPPGQPSLWGVWDVTNDRIGLIWNKQKSSYCGHEWLQYIVKEILVPKGYHSDGIINWFIEENDPLDQKWHTVVNDCNITKHKGYHSLQKEPDVVSYYDYWYPNEALQIVKDMNLNIK